MSTPLTRADVEARGFLVGEGLSMPDGDLPHAAHIDLVGGLLNGLMGPVFAAALSDQKAGHTNLLAEANVNLVVPPYAVLIPKVTMVKSKQVLQMFCDAQQVVAQAFARAVQKGLISEELAPQLCFNVGVFIDAKATNSTLIREHNALAMDLAIERAVKGVQASEMKGLVEQALAASHALTDLAAKAGQDAAASA